MSEISTLPNRLRQLLKEIKDIERIIQDTELEEFDKYEEDIGELTNQIADFIGANW